MLKVEHISVWGFEHAIRGMRNPMNSWDKSDSFECYGTHNDLCDNCPLVCWCYRSERYILGENDLDLMKRLYKAGTEHRKYLRQIFVSMDITAPLYWWKEFDTYKVGTVANSCSTMHKIHAKEFDPDDFSCEHLLPLPKDEGDLIYFELTEDVIKHGSNDGYRACFKLRSDVDAVIYGDPADHNGRHLVSPMELMNLTIKLLNRNRELYLETKDKKYWWQMIQLLPSSYNQKRTVTMNYENVVSIIKQRSNHKLDEWHILIDYLESLPYMKEIIEEETC